MALVDMIQVVIPENDDAHVRRLFTRVRQEYPDAEILIGFIVLHDGWELDNRAVVIKQADGTALVVGTDHGNTLVTLDMEDLAERLELYKVAARQTRNAIRLLKQHNSR